MYGTRVVIVRGCALIPTYDTVFSVLIFSFFFSINKNQLPKVNTQQIQYPISIHFDDLSVLDSPESSRRYLRGSLKNLEKEQETDKTDQLPFSGESVLYFAIVPN
jgi:hypothetical protein